MKTFPADPFVFVDGGVREVPPEHRQLRLFGAPAEAVFLPGRARRPGTAREPFRAPLVERILEEETLWRDTEVALTPNRHPFAPLHLLLWATEPVREAPLALLRTAFKAAEATGGTALMNTTGAAATMPRAHLHLLRERLPFLPSLPSVPYTHPALAMFDRADRTLTATRLTAPGLPVIVALTGDVEIRALASHRLLGLRGCAAINLVAQDRVTYLFPRSAIETPHPDFPHALGAAELWGRWCFTDQAAFSALDPARLERALLQAGHPA